MLKTARSYLHSYRQNAGMWRTDGIPVAVTAVLLWADVTVKDVLLKTSPTAVRYNDLVNLLTTRCWWIQIFQSCQSTLHLQLPSCDQLTVLRQTPSSVAPSAYVSGTDLGFKERKAERKSRGYALVGVWEQTLQILKYIFLTSYYWPGSM